MNRAIERLSRTGSNQMLLMTSYYRDAVKFNRPSNSSPKDDLWYITNLIPSLTLFYIDDQDYNFSFCEVMDVNNEIVLSRLLFATNAPDKLVIKYKLDVEFFRSLIDSMLTIDVPVIKEQLKSSLPTNELFMVVDSHDFALFVKKFHKYITETPDGSNVITLFGLKNPGGTESRYKNMSIDYLLALLLSSSPTNTFTSISYLVEPSGKNIESLAIKDLSNADYTLDKSKYFLYQNIRNLIKNIV